MDNLSLIHLFIVFTTTQCQVFQDHQRRITEGQEAIISCHQNLTSHDIMFWYKRDLDGKLVFLSSGYDGKSNAGSFIMSVLPKERSTRLMKTHVLPEDTAEYYCAVRVGGNNKLIFGRGTFLSITPRTDRDIPSVYRLKADNDKPEDGLPGTVCLVTDFPTPDKTLTVDGKDIQLNETSVLDKSTSDVWRYSTVIWDINNPSKDQSCNVTYDGKDVPQENLIDDAPQTCETRMISKNFKTDISLNGLSFSVLGLRLLVIKGLIFNLVSSAELWSI